MAITHGQYMVQKHIPAYKATIPVHLKQETFPSASKVNRFCIKNEYGARISRAFPSNPLPRSMVLQPFPQFPVADFLAIHQYSGSVNFACEPCSEDKSYNQHKY